MINKVYIVRCNDCHAPLREPKGYNPNPQYFYTIDNVFISLKEQKWSIDEDTHFCAACTRKRNSYKTSTEL